MTIRKRWETVSNAFEMSTAMAIVLPGCLHWLKPETTLAEMRSRAKVVDCPLFEAVLGRGLFQVSLRWLGEGSAPLS